MSEAAGNIEMYERDKKRQATGGSMLGLGIAIAGFNLDVFPDLTQLGTIEAVLLALAVSAVIGGVVYVAA